MEGGRERRVEGGGEGGRENFAPRRFGFCYKVKLISKSYSKHALFH